MNLSNQQQPPKSSFDLDFSYGYAGERLVEEILTGGKKVEVKRDRRWSETGNIYIETDCYFSSTQSWKASGLRATQAEYWAFVLEKSILIVPTKTLIVAVEELGVPINCKIPPNYSKGFLITVQDLMTATRLV